LSLLPRRLLVSGWKHLLLADAPRQTVNALTLYSFGKVNKWQTDDLTAYYDGSIVTAALLCSMIFTLLVFVGSLFLLIVAAILYVPLLCHIRGNLKASRSRCPLSPFLARYQP
jgi:hypothetical protein